MSGRDEAAGTPGSHEAVLTPPGYHEQIRIADLCYEYGEAMAEVDGCIGTPDAIGRAAIHAAARLQLIEAVHGLDWASRPKVVSALYAQLHDEAKALKNLRTKLGGDSA